MPSHPEPLKKKGNITFRHCKSQEQRHTVPAKKISPRTPLLSRNWNRSSPVAFFEAAAKDDMWRRGGYSYRSPSRQVTFLTIFFFPVALVRHAEKFIYGREPLMTCPGGWMRWAAIDGGGIAARGQDVTADGVCRGERGRPPEFHHFEVVKLKRRRDAHAMQPGQGNNQFIHPVRFAVWGRWAFMLRRGSSMWLMCACVHGTLDVYIR